MPNQSNLNMRGFAASIYQRGFTLIEMVVTLSIIAVLAGLIATQFSGDSAKATKILSDAVTIKKAALRFKLDTGEWPCDAGVLVGNMIPADMETPAGARTCRFTGGAAWNGPYLEKSSGHHFFSTGLETQYGTAGAMLIGQAARGSRGAPVSDGFPVYIEMWGLPQTVALEIMKKCTGSDDYASNNFSNSNCAMYQIGSTTTFTVGYLIGFRK